MYFGAHSIHSYSTNNSTLVALNGNSESWCVVSFLDLELIGDWVVKAMKVKQLDEFLGKLNAPHLLIQ